MPELPEVETIRRDLEKQILHKVILKVEVHDPFVLRTPPKDFIRLIQTQSVKAVTRRGKALVLHLSKSHYLVVQLMMTGQMVVNGIADKHTRVTIHFVGNRHACSLQYNDQRRFGQLRLVQDLGEVKHFSLLGPEPLEQDFTPAYILENTRSRKKPIKNLLLDHTFVAGIGNIYACEILFRCKINPTRLSSRITLRQAKDIHQKTIEVLEEAIQYRGSSMRNYRDGAGQKGGFKQRIQVYAREGEACVVCKTPIRRIVQAGRSTFYCPLCQK